MNCTVCIVYDCRYGKEEKLVNLFGIMQAIVSFVQDDKDNLRSPPPLPRPLLLISLHPVYVHVCTSLYNIRISSSYIYVYIYIWYTYCTSKRMQQAHRRGTDWRGIRTYAALIRLFAPHFLKVHCLGLRRFSKNCCAFARIAALFL